MSARDRIAALPHVVEPLRAVLADWRVSGLKLPAFRVFLEMVATADERGRVVDSERRWHAALWGDPPYDQDHGVELSAYEVWGEVRKELIDTGLVVAVTDSGGELEIVGLGPTTTMRLLTDGSDRP